MIISPNPEFARALSLSLEIRGHVVERLLGIEKIPEGKYDLGVIDIPIWTPQETDCAVRSSAELKKMNVASVAILPRGHEKPPQKMKVNTHFTRPVELLALTNNLERLTR